MNFRFRLRVVFAMCLWIGLVIFPVSALIAVLMGQNFAEFYFGEDRIFANLLLVLCGVAVLSFFCAREKNR